jgi:hypothetical protein
VELFMRSDADSLHRAGQELQAADDWFFTIPLLPSEYS